MLPRFGLDGQHLISEQPNTLGVILESFTSLIKSFAFFIPGGLGVQELAFVMIGEFVGLSGPISFSIAIGRRIREILVGVPAVAVWMILFNRKSQFN